MDPTQCCHVCMNQVHKTPKCRKIASLANFVQTCNKNFLDWCTRNQRKNSPEKAIIYESQTSSIYSPRTRGERLL